MDKLKKALKYAYKRYLIDAMGAMALGLLCSLVIGLIISQLSQISFLAFLAPIAEMVSAQSPVVGCAVGVAVAHALKAHRLVLYASAVTGALGYALGGPVGCFVTAVVSVETSRLVAGKTPVDIVVTPGVTLIAGGITAQLVGPAINAMMLALGSLINTATQLQPISMGIVMSVLMGMILTSPISSAGVSISLGLSGLAAGASVVGCCTQMVGFAVASFRENRWGGLIAQGLGTSKLQLPNIMRRPVIWLPTTIASAILGPISTSVFHMQNIPTGAGMGSSGLVGQFGAWQAMSGQVEALPLLGMLLLMHFLLPAALTLTLSELMRRAGWIKTGDMKLEFR